MQPSLWETPATVASPLCVYEPSCTHHGRAAYGPPVSVTPTCVNRTIRCLTCGRTGVGSRNLTISEASRQS
jgi:hypothetical protein